MPSKKSEHTVILPHGRLRSTAEANLTGSVMPLRCVKLEDGTRVLEPGNGSGHLLGLPSLCSLSRGAQLLIKGASCD